MQQDKKQARRMKRRLEREERKKQEYRDMLRAEESGFWKDKSDEYLDDIYLGDSKMVQHVLSEEEYQARRKRIMDFYNEFFLSVGMNEEHKIGSKFNIYWDTKHELYQELKEDDAEQRIHGEFIKDFEDYFNIYRPEDSPLGKRERR